MESTESVRVSGCADIRLIPGPWSLKTGSPGSHAWIGSLAGGHVPCSPLST